MAHVLYQLMLFIFLLTPFTFLNSRPHLEQPILLCNLGTYTIHNTLDIRIIICVIKLCNIVCK